MASPSIFQQNNRGGFTLIEILICLAILTAIISLGLFLSVDFYKSYALRSEKNTIISILQKARGQALNNINQKPHGVHFESSPAQYILFEGVAYSPADPSNIAMNASPGILVAQTPFDVIFEQLSGASVDKTIVVSGETTSFTISINTEGQISW